MITLDDDRLTFRFPDVHAKAVLTIELQRTLRIPDHDEGLYGLPPGLGRFPLRHLDDYAGRIPAAQLRRGGVITPMYQAEALWIAFESSADYPFAVKVAAGKVCAISGGGWMGHLNTDPQDYLAAPDQPWLDGFCVEEGVVRQFVAMPLGQGYTAEEQLTGEAQHGGLQLMVFPMKADRYEDQYEEHERGMVMSAPPPPAADMGLAPGGRMRQQIYADDYGLDAWDQRRSSRCFVTIANSRQWLSITGERPPTEPPSARAYTEAGLPWFDYYAGDAAALAGADKLHGLASVAQTAAAAGDAPPPDNQPLAAPRVVTLRRSDTAQVREPSGWDTY